MQAGVSASSTTAAKTEPAVLGPALASAIVSLRARLGDPTAPIAILTPSSVNGTLARRELAFATPFIRVEMWTPAELEDVLAEEGLRRAGKVVEPAGWSRATVARIVREDALPGGYEEVLREPGWTAALVSALRVLEGGRVTAAELSRVSLPAGLSDGGTQPRAFFELMWETGLRTGTLARISVPEDYEHGRATLSIRNEIDKARFGRELPLSVRARQILDEVAPRRGLVFGEHDLRARLRRAAREAGFSVERTRRLSNHALRHARATHLASRSDNLVGVAFLLGHKHLTTTAIYAKPRQRAAREVLAAVAPRGTSSSDDEPGEALIALHGAPPRDSGGIVVWRGGPELNTGRCDVTRNAPSSFTLRKAGLEPARPFERWNLNPVRLPIPPLPRGNEGRAHTPDVVGRQGRRTIGATLPRLAPARSSVRSASDLCPTPRALGFPHFTRACPSVG
jgi:integrase